jgi:hypothetical protein
MSFGRVFSVSLPPSVGPSLFLCVFRWYVPPFLSTLPKDTALQLEQTVLLLFCVEEVMLSCTTCVRNNHQFPDRKLLSKSSSSLLPMWY